MKIGVTVFVLFVGFMFIGGSAAIHSFYLGSEDALKEQVYNHLESVAQSRVLHIKDFLESDMDKVRIITAVDCIQGYVENIVNKVDVKASVALIEKCVKDVSEGNNNFFEIIVADKNGDVIVSHSQIREEHGHARINIKDEEGFIEGMKGFKVTDAHEDQGIATIGYVGPIKSVDEKEVNGVLIIHQALDGEVNKFDSKSTKGLGINNIVLDKTGLGETGESYLINKEGYMLTPSRFMPEKASFLKEKVDTINSRSCLEMLDNPVMDKMEVEHIGHEVIEIFLDYRDKKVLGTHFPIYEMQWCLLVEIDEAEALGELKIQLIKSALISLIIMVFFIFLAEYLIRGIVKQVYLKRGKK